MRNRFRKRAPRNPRLARPKPAPWTWEMIIAHLDTVQSKTDTKKKEEKTK